MVIHRDNVNYVHGCAIVQPSLLYFSYTRYTALVCPLGQHRVTHVVSHQRDATCLWPSMCVWLMDPVMYVLLPPISFSPA
jgi:hypothetical protein